MKPFMVVVKVASELFFWAMTASAQDPVSVVYDRVLATFHLQNSRRPPILRVQAIPESSPLKGAYFNPETSEIVLDKRLADRLLNDAALGEDALAFVFGHELAHFYANHALLAGTARTEPTPQERANRRSLEEDADRQGLLHAHLAGYRGSAVAPGAIAALYDLYNLRPDLEGYPSRDARVSSAGDIVRQLRPLLPLYPLVIALMAGQHLEEAALVLGYLADKFQSPDLMHNAAVLQAMLGLAKIPSEARYAGIYPFVLSTSNLLASGLRGSRGGDPDPLPHLRTAARSLDTLLERNPRDPSLRINLALVYDLLGRRQEGLALLAEPGAFPPEIQPPRVASQAILWHHAGQTQRARLAIARQKPASREIWEAFFQNVRPPRPTAGPKPHPPCPPLVEIAQRTGYSASSLWSNMTVLKGFGKVPGDSYDLSVEVRETQTALAARVRSDQVSLRVVFPNLLTAAEQEYLSSYSRSNIPTLHLAGSPISYRMYANPSCRFLVGGVDGVVKELGLFDYQW